MPELPRPGAHRNCRLLPDITCHLLQSHRIGTLVLVLVLALVLVLLIKIRKNYRLKSNGPSTLCVVGAMLEQG